MPSTIDIGIIKNIDPQNNYDESEFDDYQETIKFYDCLSIDDEELHDFMQETYEKNISASYCTLDNTGDYGIDLCGITLMPPASIEKLIDILQHSDKNYSEMSWYNSLYEKCKEAFDKNQHMIFFGV